MKAEVSSRAEREPLALAHHHPGRLRLRAKALRDSDAATQVSAALQAATGVERVAHNPRTGSLLIEYQPGLVEVESIVALVADEADLGLPPDEHALLAGRRDPALATIGAARDLNAMIAEVTGFRTDLRSIIPAALAATAVCSFALCGDRLPRWDNLLYWSYTIFSQLHRREIDEASRAGAEP